MSSVGSFPLRLLSKLGAAERLLGPRRGAPVILMYHGVKSEPVTGLVDRQGKHVPLELFRRQMGMLARQRRVVALSTLVEAVRDGREVEGMVAITFDDGYLDNFTCAAPVLAELKLPATFFLATGFIGAGRWAWVDRVEAALHAAPDGEEVHLPILDERVHIGSIEQRLEIAVRVKRALKTLPWQLAEDRVAELEGALRVSQPEPWGVYRFMGWDEVRKLVASGFDVGAHTVNHAILSRVSEDEAEREIVASRDRIVAELGACSSIFCYPNGKNSDYTPNVMGICRKHFSAALATELGAARPDELYQLRRIPVDGGSVESMLAGMMLQAQ